MFGIGHGYRLQMLEKCCERFSNVITEHEGKKAKLEENLDNIAKSIDKHLEKFKEHDKKEMEKYDRIQNEINTLKRIIYIAAGAGATFQFLIANGVIHIR